MADMKKQMKEQIQKAKEFTEPLGKEESILTEQSNQSDKLTKEEQEELNKSHGSFLR